MPPNLPTILAYALSFTATFKYPLIFIGTIIEGPILMIASGFLYRTGVFNIVLLFIALFCGDMVGDILWYYVGVYFAGPAMRRRGKFLSLTTARFERINALFHGHTGKILFISKVTMGLGLAIGTLVVAGATRIPLKTYLFFNALGELVFVSLLLCIGYFFGEIYTRVDNAFKWEYVVISAIIILLFVSLYSKYAKKIARKELLK